MVEQSELNSVQANGRKKKNTKNPKTKKTRNQNKEQQKHKMYLLGKSNTQFAANTASLKNWIIYLSFFSDAKF